MTLLHSSYTHSSFRNLILVNGLAFHWKVLSNLRTFSHFLPECNQNYLLGSFRVMKQMVSIFSIIQLSCRHKFFLETPDIFYNCLSFKYSFFIDCKILKASDSDDARSPIAAPHHTAHEKCTDGKLKKKSNRLPCVHNCL